MRKLPTALLAAVGALSLGALAAGAAQAGERLKTLDVAMPDGSIAQIRYSGDVPPQVRVVPVEARPAIAYDPFAAMERISAMMQARHAAMMRQMAELQQRARLAAAAGSSADGVVMTGTLPAGSTYSYTVVTSNGSCTQRVDYVSSGPEARPQVTQASSGDCSAAPKVRPVVPVAAPAGKAEPAKPAPGYAGQSHLPSVET